MYQFFATIAGLCLIATIVGLIRPGIFRFKSRKAAALYGFGSMFAFQLLAMSLESDEHRQQRETEQAARQDSIVAAEKTQQAAQQPREALEASPKPEKGRAGGASGLHRRSREDSASGTTTPRSP